MGIQTIGNRNFEGGIKPEHEVDRGCTTEKEARHAALARSKAARIPTAAVDATVFAEIALDFDGAQSFKEALTPEEAKARAVKNANLAGADGDELARLANADGAALARDMARTAMLKQMDRPLKFGDRKFAIGDWYGHWADDETEVVAFSDEEKTSRFAGGGGGSPRKPSNPTAATNDEEEN